MFARLCIEFALYCVFNIQTWLTLFGCLLMLEDGTDFCHHRGVKTDRDRWPVGSGARSRNFTCSPLTWCRCITTFVVI